MTGPAKLGEITLVCDVLACPVRLVTKLTDVDAAVEHGRRAGWSCSDVGDLCPKHAS